ncbi:hypothetical protein CUR178_05405 [Leishmania enriettii]|uniref:Uncharacterized protein n=1 Tax=Leishmania enriettii TaxID=5663 RepID=A0A836HJ12_LEIEN|nr:hypothetical protein CUR178_05405 [Leishmania enriettii]
MDLVFALIYLNRPAIAVCAVGPAFSSILEQQEDDFTVVPELLTYFLPHMSCRGIPLEDRVAMVADQLITQGFRFSVAFTSPPPLRGVSRRPGTRLCDGFCSGFAEAPGERHAKKASE